MELRRLGGLGHQSSVLIYGAAALGDVDQDTADALGPGGARRRHQPLRRGPRLRRRRAPARPRGCRGSATRSSWPPRPASGTGTPPGRRSTSPWSGCSTDTVDLLQLHAVGDLDELDKVTRTGGALEAALRAQEEGLVGAVGITGHSHTAAEHAPGGAAPAPVRLGAHAAEPGAVAGAGLPRGLRGARRRGAAPGRRADDDQDRRAPQLARGRRPAVRHLVRAAERARADPGRRLVGARAPRGDRAGDARRRTPAPSTSWRRRPTGCRWPMPRPCSPATRTTPRRS